AIALVMTLWISTDLIDRLLAWSRKGIGILTALVLGLLPKRFFGHREKEAPKRAEMEETVEKLTKEHPEWRVGLLRYILREGDRHSKALKQK
ncbi:MAG TPA: hypothetical protein VGB78_11905, partial [Thermoplasmata archaeon]